MLSDMAAFDGIFAFAWFIGFPMAVLCFQYGFDLVCDATVPIHPDYLER